MKMKSAFVLLAAITLVACSSNASKLPSSSIEDNSSNSTSAVSSESSSTSGASSNSSGSKEPVGVVTKTVSFLNGGFTNSTLNQAASQTQFVEWFNKSANILSSIDYSGYAQMNYIGNANDSWRFSTLILGSQNSEGAITFNFNVHVVSVKIVVQPYTKYISYNDTYNIDKSAKFYFNEEEHDLSVDANHSGDTEKVTLECFPNQNENKFKIANKEAGQRVFVHSFELTYWG